VSEYGHDKLLAEIDRLRGLVRDAYEEGYNQACVDDEPQPGAWEFSEMRKIDLHDGATDEDCNDVRRRWLSENISVFVRCKACKASCLPDITETCPSCGAAEHRPPPGAIGRSATAEAPESLADRYDEASGLTRLDSGTDRSIVYCVALLASGESRYEVSSKADGDHCFLTAPGASGYLIVGHTRADIVAEIGRQRGLDVPCRCCDAEDGPDVVWGRVAESIEDEKRRAEDAKRRAAMDDE